MKRFSKTKATLVYVGLFLMAMLPKTTSAYYTGARWPNIFQVGYSIDPQLDVKLNVTGTTTKINSAASKWNKASNLVLYSTTYPNMVTISTKDFTVANPCNSTDPLIAAYAVVCFDQLANNNNDIIQQSVYFNISSNISWNTSGSINCGSTPRKIDFSTGIIHEFGHLFHLKDYSQYAPNFDAVMAFNCTKKLNLLEDDLQGATQMYGPMTGWENGYAQGDVSNISFTQSTIAYNGSGLPELRPRTAEFSVPVKTGSKYELIAGNAQQFYSYVGFKLFTQDNDASTMRNYLKIEPRMYLEWDQYNYQKTTMSLDFTTLEGRTMVSSP